MSLPAIPDPTSASVELLREACLSVRVWADECDDIGQACEALDRIAAIETYLSRKGQQAEAQEAARWLEVRIGELLGPAEATNGKPLTRELKVIPAMDRMRFRQLAAHRELVASLLPCSRSMALKEIQRTTRTHEPRVAGLGFDGHYDEVPAEFHTIVIDPPWQYDNTATRGSVGSGSKGNHYETMSLERLAALDLPAADDCHLYLWVTNGFIREGFGLVEAWGFTYKTCLTWCKPQIGMGNWFRNTTEHVLFAVKGRQPTLRNDARTHFVADRTRHSAKPESFYDLVESCSPGPYFEMFARRQRFGWAVFGNEFGDVA